MSAVFAAKKHRKEVLAYMESPGSASVLHSSLRGKRVAIAGVLSGCRYPTMNDNKHTSARAGRKREFRNTSGAGSLSSVLQLVAQVWGAVDGQNCGMIQWSLDTLGLDQGFAGSGHRA